MARRQHGDLLARLCPHDLGTERGAIREMRHRRVLRLEHRAVFRRVRDFQHEPFVACDDEKILITLTRQRRRGRDEAVQLVNDADGRLHREPGRLLKQSHPIDYGGPLRRQQ